MPRDIQPILIRPNDTLGKVLESLNESGMGIVLVVDDQRRLIGTITDGDVRRAILAKLDLSTFAAVILERKAGTIYSKPFVAGQNDNPEHYLKILRERTLLHLPLVDGEGKVVSLVTMDDFVSAPIPLQAVVMAGGRGTRLFPLTEDCPKPMLTVGDRPLLEIIIERLKQAGIQQVSVSTHHKEKKITEHFGDGGGFGVDLNYVSEERPLGTAGALGLMAMSKETLLIINGDILTDVDFKAMLNFHREHKADLTVAVRQYDLQVPYGVVECNGEVVKRLQEKPVCNFLVNAGIYLMEPIVRQYIPRGERQDMTDLIHVLIENGRSVISFPVHEEWLDIGTHAEYQLAQTKV